MRGVHKKGENDKLSLFCAPVPKLRLNQIYAAQRPVAGFPKKWHGDALEPHNDWILTGTTSDWKWDPKHKKGPDKLSGLCFLTFLHLVSCHCASHLVKPMHILLIPDLLGGSQICWYVRSTSGGKRFDVRCRQMPKGKIETKQVVSPWKHFISIISDQEWKGSVQSTTRALTVQ